MNGIEAKFKQTLKKSSCNYIILSKFISKCCVSSWLIVIGRRNAKPFWSWIIIFVTGFCQPYCAWSCFLVTSTVRLHWILLSTSLMPSQVWVLYPIQNLQFVCLSQAVEFCTSVGTLYTFFDIERLLCYESKNPIVDYRLMLSKICHGDFSSACMILTYCWSSDPHTGTEQL